MPQQEIDLVNARASIQYVAERVRKGALPQVKEELLLVKNTLDMTSNLIRRVISSYSQGHRPSPDTIHELSLLVADYREQDWILAEEPS